LSSVVADVILTPGFSSSFPEGNILSDAWFTWRLEEINFLFQTSQK